MSDSKIKFISLFLKNSGGLSSKRVLAIIGVLTCVGVFIAAFVLDKQVPEFGEILLISCISLYGVEVIPNFWSKTINQQK